MSRILPKILLDKTKPMQLLVALTGLFTGLLVVMAGSFVYRSVNNLLAEKELLAGDYLVLGKKAGLLNTITGSSPSFSESEISELKQLEGIDKVGTFIPGSFKASMQLAGTAAEFAGQGFRTDMFFESVPDDFVDANTAVWKWKQGDPVVPLIIPSDFIQLYNSAFAQSQGLPVLPESVLKSVEFDVTITGNGRAVDYRARIAGFSKRINTVLVPQSFMEYANREFGNRSPRAASRVILHSNNPASPVLAQKLKSRGFELNEEKLKSSELNNVLQILISAVAGVGLLIVLLSVLGFIQYNQLLAYRSAWEIQTLSYIGFTRKKIARPYIRFILVALLATTIAAIIGLFMLRIYFSKVIESRGIDIELPGLGWSVGAGFVISLIIAAVSWLSAYRQIKQLAA